MNEEQSSLLLNSCSRFPPPKGVRLAYGTGGFREDASILQSTVFRVGILAALRSLKTRSVIGPMITASHNKVSDNGVKISDPNGGMLSQDWEPFADALANAPLLNNFFKDDPELDKMMKDRVRWGDPMAHLVKKKYSEPVLPDLGDSEKMTESVFIVPQDIPSHSWMKRGLDAAPNRYGIKSGRHWDGVDRSNGFEKQMFKRTNEKQATEREAYIWSVSDM
ncbi:hypothetical protein HS088_TW15G00594 [Tripterygium wilfordii]|uniref:Alpha-D-phosphohexomutase alpha/beta/alpha domain-containing protein n=1 Tax=Tripterygium wilfordii TaxID=458696 RepID=A0A7J7CM23_TRIWF|nr:pre-mRNA-splicing factor CWC26-like [Tripterygium wilfordii]KAF5735094.1 hypothetical protein HS088_TW15G00594 [Tripterygium wilfordii]